MADGSTATYTTTLEAGPPGVWWTTARAHGSRVLALAEPLATGARPRCLASLRSDLSVEWSTLLEEEGGDPHLVTVGETPYLVFVRRISITLRAIDPRTGALGPEIRADGPGARSEWTRVGGSATDRLLVAWNDAWTIDARVYTTDGEPIGEPVRISTNGRYPEVSDVGDAWILGYHEGGSGVVQGPVAVAVDRDGVPRGEPVRPDGHSFGGGHLIATRMGPELVAAWSRGRDLRFARLDASLLPVEAPTTVVDTGSALTSLGAMTSALDGSVLSYHLAREAVGGVVYVPWAEPAATVRLLDLPGSSFPPVAVVGDVVVVLHGDHELHATRLTLP